MKNIVKVFIQILKEFWIPFILSIVWVFYNIYDDEYRRIWEFKHIIGVFAPTFFLMSWMTGQFFRVKKQVTVESGLKTLEGKLQTMINELESKTQHLIGITTGGESFARFHIVNIENNKGTLIVIHNGIYPLYDVQATIIDLQKFRAIKEILSLSTLGYAQTTKSIGNLSPSQGLILGDWTIDGESEKAYNISITARNGIFTQLLRLKKNDGIWLLAAKVMDSSGKILHTAIDDKYPRNSIGEVEWE